MSTRANIILYDRWGSAPIYLYHHHDGFFEGVGRDLVKRLDGRKSGWCASCIANELVKDCEDEYEITVGVHGDVEYIYKIIAFAKFMEVWAANYSSGKEVWTLEKEISFDENEEEK